ncbi:hypothetical protein [Shewanella sp. GXUN23E]|uniref:hypothetical protein n=1 Tax=Shewanella sp. GXUN23E TaxID=3422498 RepID=UPI003D7E7E2D
MKLRIGKLAILIALLWQLLVASVLAMPASMLEQVHHASSGSHHAELVTSSTSEASECCLPMATEHCGQHCVTLWLNTDKPLIPSESSGNGRILLPQQLALTGLPADINRPPIKS